MTTLNIQTTATAKELETLKAFLHSIDPQAIIQESPLSPQDTLELHRIYKQYKDNTLTFHTDSQTQEVMAQKGIKW